MYRRRNSSLLSTAFYALAALAPLMSGCLDTDMAKRFREAFGPGFFDGISAAVDNPTAPEEGFQQSIDALLDGFAAILDTRTPPSASSGSTQTGS